MSKGSKYMIWREGFYDFNVYSERKLQQKLRYIHYNPVRAGLVKNQVDCKYSSVQNYFLDGYSVINMNSLGL